jgi:hypothetical protein
MLSINGIQMYVKGWGNTQDDCVKYLDKHPELKAQGYEVRQLQGTWVVARSKELILDLLDSLSVSLTKGGR